MPRRRWDISPRIPTAPQLQTVQAPCKEEEGYAPGPPGSGLRHGSGCSTEVGKESEASSQLADSMSDDTSSSDESPISQRKRRTVKSGMEWMGATLMKKRIPWSHEGVHTVMVRQQHTGTSHSWLLSGDTLW